MNRTSLFTEDKLLSMLQGSLLVISPTDLLRDVQSTPTHEMINKGKLNTEKLN